MVMTPAHTLPNVTLPITTPPGNKELEMFTSIFPYALPQMSFVFLNPIALPILPHLLSLEVATRLWMPQLWLHRRYNRPSLELSRFGLLLNTPKLSSLHFYNFIHVPPIGCAGGLCVAWKNGVDFEPTFLSKNAISGIVYSDPVTTPWSLTAVYRPPNVVDRESFWDKLESMIEKFAGPWLLISEFNGTLSNLDRAGGNPSSSTAASRALQNNVQSMGLIS
ncbi:hypothetical protein TorRG33x02_292330 [Trema orientale]|uniref:Endonuclease/exonuclease/phosphatase n=1 Tax=Trema orientale TaxID=63057 RepID=A0A2P5CAA0_TREOI|nr:hypothetical protein TorRG33x02_292330 [Trema orientale]